MHTAILIPDGVGVRNFLLGTFLKESAECGDVTVLHRIPECHLPDYKRRFSDNIKWQRCLPQRDPASTFFLRRSLAHAHLCHWDTKGMQFVRQMPIGGRWHKRAVIRTAKAYGRISASSGGISQLAKLHSRSVRKSPEFRHYLESFKALRPDVVFCTHQRALEAVPITLAAKALGIPTATFIYSWDNLSSKGRFAAEFDHFFVWSDLMRSELLQFYPEVGPEQVHIVGTPQFDPYGDDSILWSREEFCRKVALDPSRPIICYSGGDVGTTPEDHLHVRILMEQVRSGRIKKNSQVLVRPSPVDHSNRFDQVRADYPEMSFCRPEWFKPAANDWSTVIPTEEDVQFLANLVHHSDINVNVSSTMTLDFAIHDKPVVNIAFDVADPPPFGLPMRDYYYEFEHYRAVVDLGAARIAESAEAMADGINGYLDDPSRDREERRKFVELEVDLPIGNSRTRIINALERICNR